MTFPTEEELTAAAPRESDPGDALYLAACADSPALQAIAEGLAGLPLAEAVAGALIAGLRRGIHIGRGRRLKVYRRRRDPVRPWTDPYASTR